MYLFFVLLSFLSFVAFFIALIRPSLFKFKNRKQSSLFLGGAIIIFFITAIVTTPLPDAQEVTADAEDTELNDQLTLDDKEEEITKEQLTLELIEATFDAENKIITVKGKTNLADGIEIGVSLEGENEYDFPVMPGFGIVENGGFSVTLGEGDTIENGHYPIKASFGSYDNEVVNEVYGDYNNFINSFDIPGSVEETDIGFNVNKIPLGEIEITEGFTAEEVKQLELEQKKSIAEEISFAHLNKNPDRYAGEYVKYTGEIVQIQEGDGWTIIRLAVTESSYGYDFNDIVWVEYEGYTDFIDEDIVTVYGTIMGSHSYTSQAGWEITVPALLADIIE
ncbi:hypothetical protein [Halalkalibacter oceani]|uniref:hypothetical protein n=1 Tax=Halalkalibacter oceani TaxID=1653776 RepID=UPI003399F50E